MGGYFSVGEEKTKQMLSVIGCEKIDDLFDSIPKEARLHKELNLSSGLSELEVKRQVKQIAGENKVFPTIFRGAGAYRHYIPSIVKSVTSKEEFITAYTPYQAEISQGLLQSIFEFQTMISELTGMDGANASVYDGPSAAAEAVAMCRERNRNKVLVSESTPPQVLETIKTYCYGNGIEVITIPVKDGTTDLEHLKEKLDKSVAALYIQNPNFYGIIEEVEVLGELIHSVGGKYIAGVNPISLGALKAPGEYGADIAVGEGQPLGLPLAFGGPYLGFMTCTSQMTRKLPGRIVGQTTDVDGKRAFVLTLQAREQHIRREKASSNICSNQALCALTASVYMAAMGKEGIKNVGIHCMSKARYLEAELAKLGFTSVYGKEYFHEFVTKSPVEPETLLHALEQKGILGGLALEGKDSGSILWCCTEMNTKQEIDRLIDSIKEVL